METNRKPRVGDRVRVKSVIDLKSCMDRDGRFPEEFGSGLYFADEMYEYAGVECEIWKTIKSDGRPMRYRLLRKDTGEGIQDWVWCQSMLDDAEEEEEVPLESPLENPVDFLLGL